jgi:hypothetical protein
VRPTVGEQLAGAARILEELVLPEVEGRYAATPLRSVITALEGLAVRWETVIADLMEENDDGERVVAPLLAPYADRLPDLAALLAEAANGAAAAGPYPVFADVHERNLRWRAVVAEALPLVQDDPPVHSGLRAHLRKYAERNP